MSDQLIAENWREAEGVRSEGQTNSALAPRDYTVSCQLRHHIAHCKGYWLWWCSAHHQPMSSCEIDKLKIEVKRMTDKVANLKRTVEELVDE